MKKRRAFSLIELLVVVAIIGVLVALAFPVISKAKSTALGAKSFNNLRQIGAALALFIADHNGEIMPRVYASTAPAGQNRYWTATLYNFQYLPDKEAFYDPRFAPFSAEKSTKPLETGTPETYGMRDWVRPGETIGSSTARVAKKVAVVESPGDFFIVADSYWTVWGTQGYGISPGAGGANRVRLDKDGFANALFLDGHVEKKPGSYFEQLGVTQGDYSDNQPYPTWLTAQ